MRKLSFVGVAAVLAGVLYLPPGLWAAGPGIFVRFGGWGYSNDPNHTNRWTDALSISDGLVGPSLPSSKTAQGFTLSPLQVTKLVDGDSAYLRQLLVYGNHIPRLEIELTLPDDTSRPIQRITLYDVQIASMTMAVPSILGSWSSDTGPVSGAKETITIRPGERLMWESWGYDAQGSQTKYSRRMCDTRLNCN